MMFTIMMMFQSYDVYDDVSKLLLVLFLITAGPNTKLFAWGEGESGGLVLNLEK
jgi:hypothetical protein